MTVSFQKGLRLNWALMLKKWQRRHRKQPYWLKIKQDTTRDEDWWVDSRGQGVINIGKFMESEAGQELLNHHVTLSSNHSNETNLETDSSSS